MVRVGVRVLLLPQVVVIVVLVVVVGVGIVVVVGVVASVMIIVDIWSNGNKSTRDDSLAWELRVG